MVTSVRVRNRPSGDAKMLIPMLEGMWADELEVVHGDKAYLSKFDVTYIHSLSAKAVIEPKRGLTRKAHGHREYARLVKEYPGNPEDGRRNMSTGRGVWWRVCLEP